MHLSQKQNTCSQYSCAFFKSTLDFEKFRKKITPMAYVFPKSRPTKYVVK